MNIASCVKFVLHPLHLLQTLLASQLRDAKKVPNVAALLLYSFLNIPNPVVSVPALDYYNICIKPLAAGLIASDCWSLTTESTVPFCSWIHF